jgi:hypothetical protein
MTAKHLDMPCLLMQGGLKANKDLQLTRKAGRISDLRATLSLSSQVTSKAGGLEGLSYGAALCSVVKKIVISLSSSMMLTNARLLELS